MMPSLALLALSLAAAAGPSPTAPPPEASVADAGSTRPELAIGTGPSARAALPAAFLADPYPRPRLRLGAVRGATLATGVLALAAANEIERSTDVVTGCRWCAPGAFDRWARGAIRWGDTRLAGEASDVLLLAVPLGTAAAALSLAVVDDVPRGAIEDALVIGAALVAADSLTSGLKHGTARLRPNAWAAGGPAVEGDLHSFVSGHTSRVFAAAAAAAQLTRLRGRPGWKWVAAIGLTAAAATGWLRVAADRHWATDVVGGAVVGVAAGYGVATAALRPLETPLGPIAIVPSPGGLAVFF